jgi:membrane protease YdiL (CAAX protease family)
VAWSYLFWQFLFIVIPIDPAQGPTLAHILLAGLGGSPSLFGILLTYLSDGKAGLRNLLDRVVRWRVGLAWYAAALLLVPSLNAVIYVLYGLLERKFYPVTVAALGFGILAGIMSSLLEEFGWRGFALPVLQQRQGAFVASLIVGLGWGLWHLRLNSTMMSHYGALALPLLILSTPVGLTAMAVLMTWVLNNSRNSLLLMLLFHLSLTSSSFVFGPPPTTGGAELLRYHLVAMVVQWSVVAVVVALTDARRLVPERRQHTAFRSHEGEA